MNDGTPPSDPSRPGELEAENGVESQEDWIDRLVPAGGPDGEAAAGDEAAAGPATGPPLPEFEEVVRLHGRRLYQLAYRLTANREEAEDLSQETLVRGYLALASFRGEAGFYTYLYRALLNLWKNQIRSRRCWRMVSLGDDRDPENDLRAPPRELADRSAGPHERLAGREQAAKLHLALLELPPDFRAVLVLRAAEGLEYEEIATALGISIGTVRSRLARARSRIRELMEGKGR